MQKGIYPELPINSETFTVEDIQINVQALTQINISSTDLINISSINHEHNTVPAIIIDEEKLCLKNITAKGIPSKPKTSSIQKKYNQLVVFIISVLAHLLLLIALWFAAKNTTLSKANFMKSIPEVKTIKSYLYQKPIQTKTLPVEPVEPVEVSSTKVPEKTQNPEEVKKESATKQERTTIHSPEKVKPIEQISKESNTKVESVAAPPLPTKRTFSAYGQLSKLRDSINKDMVQKEMDERNVFRSASEMTADQIPVPHSQVKLTPQQEKEKNTSNFGGGTITKYDDGYCIIEREQMLGSPVESTTSAFACGESKFDKSFREHMKKVNAKLRPTKKPL